MIFQHQSHVYLRDDEFYELMSPKNIASTDLLKLARRRGLIFSPRTPNEDVRTMLATLPSDWRTVSHIFEVMARPDPDERKSTLQLANCDAKTNVFDLVKNVQAERQKNNAEAYVPEKISEDTVRIDVTYPEKNLSRAVPYQTRIRKLFVEITKRGDEVSFVYTANERAQEIVEALQKPIKATENKKRNSFHISLFAVRDPALRSKFFLELIKDVEGYRFVGANHVNVDRRFPELEVEDDEANDDEEEVQKTRQNAKQAAQVKSIINKIALTGENVLSDEIYQQAARSGYYISGITWTCINRVDARFFLDLEAGFVDAVKADQFSFDVTRQWRYKPERPDVDESVSMTSSERRRYIDLVRAAAFRSYKKIVEEAA